MTYGKPIIQCLIHYTFHIIQYTIYIVLYVIHYTLFRISDDDIERLKWINFPPIISKRQVDESILSPYMETRYEQDNRKLDQEALLQTYRGEGVFVLSELLAYYMEMGYEIRNVRMATQYLGENCLAQFINKVMYSTLYNVECILYNV